MTIGVVGEQTFGLGNGNQAVVSRKKGQCRSSGSDELRLHPQRRGQLHSIVRTQRMPGDQCLDPGRSSLRDIALDQCAAVEEVKAHPSPLSSMMISERGLPGACPSLSANSRRSSSAMGATLERSGGGVSSPAATRARIAASPSSSTGSSGRTWSRTIWRSCKFKGRKGRSKPFSYTAVTISVISHLTWLVSHASRVTSHVIIPQPGVPTKGQGHYLA